MSAASFGLTVLGAFEIYKVVSVAGVTVLQWVFVTLFIVNFAWISRSFAMALVGFFRLLRRPAPRPIPDALRGRTAVVMPVCNESTERVFAALEAMVEEVRSTGLIENFELFILSDSTRPDVRSAEERAFWTLRGRAGLAIRIWYRNRKDNIGRKAGNIQDFVSRWGGAFEHMLILDADSLMTGACIVKLAAAMEADPDAGIIQSLPLPINRNTLFARLQQFASRVYGAVGATGLSVWSGREGNYWGHNAIIRIGAFAAHCGLPTLPGKPPFGGHILSHDFVEAALICRAGWAVYMLPDLAGSYEEIPPTLIDLAARDKRWCQGNLQHSRVIGATGLTWPTRQHFATGILSYLAAPLWLSQFLVGIILVIQAWYIGPNFFTRKFFLFPTWLQFDARRASQLFCITLVIFIAPKLLGLIITLLRGAEWRSSGGRLRLAASVLFEVLISALISPLSMVLQTGAVLQFFLGRDTGWSTQHRDDGSIPLNEILVRHSWHMLIGIFASVSALMMAPALWGWMSPTLLSLVFAVPISVATGKISLGSALKHVGLLVTPEETSPPPIATRANMLMREYSA